MSRAYFSHRPFEEDDSPFGKALREARKSGVEVYAYKCKARDGEAFLAKEIKVRL